MNEKLTIIIGVFAIIGMVCVVGLVGITIMNSIDRYIDNRICAKQPKEQCEYYSNNTLLCQSANWNC